MMMNYFSFGPAMLAVMVFATGIAIVVYFIPSIVAYARGARNFLAIFLLNLFLGWSLLGWVGSLIWALLDEKKDYVRVQIPYTAPLIGPQTAAPQSPAAATTGAAGPARAFCSHCGQAVSPDDHFCGHCGHTLERVP